MPLIDDDYIFARPPQRIVSLVPSQTELLYDLGLEEEVVGITKFCVHPHQWFRNKARVGGTKTVHMDRVRDLQPELILANKEENLKDQVLQLADIAPVWVSDIHTLDDALHMISTIGKLSHRSIKAEDLCTQITLAFDEIPKPVTSISVLYLIWQEPWMAAAGDTFIHDMLQHLGLQNVLGAQHRYPELTDEALQRLQPDWVLLSSEPYPFKAQHVAAVQRLLPRAKISLVDGELFSWYGSRLLQAPAYFKKILKEYAR